jgi:eukaryotic-like serine/threonine-protein kinase
LDPDSKIIISDRFRIDKRIASGGMADIYLGEDIVLKRKVAIKILSPNYAGDRNFVARFKSEAGILTRLNHPNIVEIYSWGKFDSSYYIVMEYVNGTSLKEFIDRKGPIDPGAAAGFALQICDALGTAHENNLIHRDIKPQNILITPENKIKVTDFGIAKSVNTDVTRTLNIIGTAHYISPEQARGDILDNRTDIYSLGVVMYEMITGDIPFRGDTSIDISLKHLNEKPVRPSRIINDLPKDIEKIVMTCLEKEPSKRYERIEDLKNDLNRFLKNRPIRGAKRKKEFASPNKFSEKLKKNPVLLILSLIAFIFMVLFVSYAILYHQKEKPSPVVIQVPPLKSASIDTAGQILSLLGLKIDISGEEKSSEIPEDHIIEQSPAPYSSIAEGGTVKVIISSGEDITAIDIPDLTGLEVEKAKGILAEMGLKAGTISYVSSEEFEENTVISQDPPKGSSAVQEEAIDLEVSSGPETIIVPNIIGLDFAYASRYLESLGINITTGMAPINEKAGRAGIVVSAEPAPGTAVKKDTVVKILVSVAGPLNEIPSLEDMDVQQAGALLDSLGIIYEELYIEPDYSFQKDEVLGQWPQKGSYLPESIPVIIYIGK